MEKIQDTIITPDKLAEIAYQAGMFGDESENCPSFYGGYAIPEDFLNGEESWEIWGKHYKEGRTDSGDYEVEGNFDNSREDWQE